MINTKLSIGQLAKQGNVTVRTLQYYDSIGLLKPSYKTDGGRRQYDHSDIAILHQIVTLKSFGLSLDEIKHRLMPVESDIDIIKLLDQQSLIIDEQISKSKMILESINMLKNDIIASNVVDWSKYTSMLKLVSENNENYWIMKFLDSDILNSITEVHKDESDPEEALIWLKTFLEQAFKLNDQGHDPKGKASQALAHEWWLFMQKYTDGDPALMMQFYKFYLSADQWPDELGKFQNDSQAFLKESLEYYINKWKEDHD